VTLLDGLFEELDHRRTELSGTGVVDVLYRSKALEFVLGG
jgi:hypothetical protein